MKWDEKLTALSADLADLSKKTADAAADAKAYHELRDEVIQDKISTLKGNIAALQNKASYAEEESKSKISSALLKAQMSVKARIQDRREAIDKKLLEKYIDEEINYVLDCYDSAALLIANAQLAILEALDAAAEYEVRFGEKKDEE